MASKRVRKVLVVQVRLADGREDDRRFRSVAESKAWAERRGAVIVSKRWIQVTTWRALVPQPGGGYRQPEFAGKGAAEAHEAAEKAARSIGVNLDLAAELLTDVVARWRDGVGADWEAKTAEQADSFLRAHVLPVFGDWPVGKIRHSDVQAWVGRMKLEGAGRAYHVTLVDGSAAVRVFKTETDAEAWAVRKPGRVLGSSQPKGLSQRTVRGVIALLSRILDSSVRDGALHRNPCDGINFGKGGVSGRSKYSLERPEVWKLAEAMPDRYRALVLTGALAGLRFEELAGLRRDRILSGIPCSRIRVDQAVVSVNGHLITKGPKSKKSRREVPIPSVLAEVLEAHCERFGVGPSDPVFTSPTGGPLRHGNFSRRVLGPVSEEVLGAPIGTHDLRRTCGALWRAAGIDLKVIQGWMGHSSERVTSDLYTEVIPSLEAASVALVEAANSVAVSGPVLGEVGPEIEGEISTAL